MVVSARVGQLPTMAQPSWLSAEEDEDVVLLIVTGGIAASRAAELWCSIEDALERAQGRLVAVDFTRVTAFDERTIDEVLLVVKASARRRLHLCAITHPHSPFDHYLRCALAGSCPTFFSLAEALTSQMPAISWSAA